MEDVNTVYNVSMKSIFEVLRVGFVVIQSFDIGFIFSEHHIGNLSILTNVYLHTIFACEMNRKVSFWKIHNGENGMSFTQQLRIKLALIKHEKKLNMIH